MEHKLHKFEIGDYVLASSFWYDNSNDIGCVEDITARYVWVNGRGYPFRDIRLLPRDLTKDQLEALKGLLRAE